MAQDSKVIAYVSPGEMAALMAETGMITIHENESVDGQPVIHAALKVVNAQTGEQLPGGLPFSVLLFKNPREPGYSNIAIGAVIPTAELEINLPRDYFNLCNQRFRFTRAFPLDERSFVLQMDLFVHNATREYVKFMFGVWSAMFSQVLFELMGRGREALTAAVEAYAAVRSDLSQQYVATTTLADEPAADEVVMASPVEPEAAGELQAEPHAEPVLPVDAQNVQAEAAGLAEQPVAAETEDDELCKEDVILPPPPKVEESDPISSGEKAVEPTAEASRDLVAEAMQVSPDMASQSGEQKETTAV